MTSNFKPNPTFYKSSKYLEEWMCNKYLSPATAITFLYEIWECHDIKVKLCTITTHRMDDDEWWTAQLMLDTLCFFYCHKRTIHNPWISDSFKALEKWTWRMMMCLSVNTFWLPSSYLFTTRSRFVFIFHCFSLCT